MEKGFLTTEEDILNVLRTHTYASAQHICKTLSKSKTHIDIVLYEMEANEQIVMSIESPRMWSICTDSSSEDA